MQKTLQEPKFTFINSIFKELTWEEKEEIRRNTVHYQPSYQAYQEPTIIERLFNWLNNAKHNEIFRQKNY